jgi:hypothetical protein
MPNESSEESLSIRISADYDGTGAKQAIDDQNKIVDATNRATSGGGDKGAELARQREQSFERYAKEVAKADAAKAAADAVELSAEQQKQVTLERELIVATQRAALEAKTAGDTTELTKLQAELAVRQVTLNTLRTSVMTQAQMNEFLAAQNLLIEEGAVAATEEAAARAAAAGAAEGWRDIRAGAHAFHGLEAAMEGSRFSARTLTMSLHGLWELFVANPILRVVTAIGAVTIALGEWVKKSAEARQKVIEDNVYNMRLVRRLMLRWHDDWGLPSILYLENGMWKKAKILKGDETDASHTEMGLREFGVSFTHAKLPRGKIIENIIGQIQNQMERLPGYAGRDEVHAGFERVKEQIDDVNSGRVHPSRYFFSKEQWSNELTRILEVYNVTPQEGRIIKGRGCKVSSVIGFFANRAPLPGAAERGRA